MESAPRRVDPGVGEPERLATAVRVFTTRHVSRSHAEPRSAPTDKSRQGVRRRYPREALVFDTETLPGPAQGLRFLVWRFYRDPPGGEGGVSCIEEGIAYPDDLPETAPDEWRLLCNYVEAAVAVVASGFPTEIRLEPVSWWLEERLFRYGYAHRDRCDLVGFNLLFDLGRLARYWAPAKGDYRGGYSLAFWGDYDNTGKWRDRKHRGRLRLRAIDPRRTLFRWAARGRNDPDPNRGPGRFVDLRTLAFALTDRSHSLESACKAFGDPYEKTEVDYAVLTPVLLDYAREDVAHTATLYRNCLTELARHQGVTLEPHRLYSPATVGARYLEAFGLRRPLVKFTELTGEELGWDRPGTQRSVIGPDEPRGNLHPSVLGFAMSAFYGGRAEARIVRTPVPVVLVDFTSMYPSVNALLGTWKLLRAATLKTVDATEQVRSLLAAPDLFERCLTPDLWRELAVTLVELEPGGDVLPSRARYDPAGTGYGIGVNPLTYEGQVWYALPDVVAATILNPLEHATAKIPRVVRAIRLEPVGTQPGLQPVALRGGTGIDPTSEDPFVRMIELRQQVRRDPALGAEERERLDRFLKITANATAYGVLARFDRRERANAVPVTVYGPDPNRIETTSETPEDPGPYCFPPIAASITAAARLMLALLERLVRDHGGHYAFCDTDSMAIIATPDGEQIDCPTADGDNQIKTLAWEAIDQILARFDRLNPYDRTLVPSPWKIEADSTTRPLWCYAISAKRYCLYHLDQHGTPEILATIDASDGTDGDQPLDAEHFLEDWSEHGLGLYLDPTSPDRPRRDSKGRRLWTQEAWQWTLADAHGLKPPLPAWADAYALTRFTTSSPRTENWFTGYNTSRHPGERIRPGSFGLLAHPIQLGTTGPLPAAPYETDPSRWPTLDWYDRRTGNPIRLITLREDDDPEARAHALARGDVPVHRLRDILTRYRRRPEHKSLDPTGNPAGPDSHGLLQRRPITSSPTETELTGKEGNRLLERASGEITDPTDYRNTYGRRNNTWSPILDVVREIGVRTIVEQTGFSRSAIYDVLRGVLPRAERAHVYAELALGYARQRLDAWNLPVPDTPSGTLAQYLGERDRRGKNTTRCEWCAHALRTEQRRGARYCSAGCRGAAHRARSARREHR